MVCVWDKIQGDAVHPLEAPRSVLKAHTDSQLRFTSYASSTSQSNS